MTARRKMRMRRLINTTVDMVRAGELSVDVAAHKLLESGVPMAVIGRVLASASTSQPPGEPSLEPGGVDQGPGTGALDAA